MNIPSDDIEHHIEQIEYYLKKIKDSIKYQEFYSPEGYCYTIIEECRELIQLIKPFQKDL